MLVAVPFAEFDDNQLNPRQDPVPGAERTQALCAHPGDPGRRRVVRIAGATSSQRELARWAFEVQCAVVDGPVRGSQLCDARGTAWDLGLDATVKKI